MKRLIILILLIIISCKEQGQNNSSAGQSRQQLSPDFIDKDIDEMFLKIPHKAIDDSLVEFNRLLSNKDKKNYISRKDVTDGKIKKLSKNISVVVDKKNYYMNVRFNTEYSSSTSYGGYDRTYVMYFMTDKTPVFAMSGLNIDEKKQESFFTILKPVNNEWKDVTKEIFPLISVKDFWDEKVTLTEANEKECRNFLVEYYLPREGTRIKVTLGGDYLGDTWEGILHEFRNIRYDRVIVDWKKDKGKFEIVNKTVFER